MESINALTAIDYSSLFIASFSVLIGIKAIVSLFEWLFDKLGIETKWMRQKREEHNLLIQTSKGLIELQKKHEEDIIKSVKNNAEIRKDIKNLTDMFVQKEIDDMRWEIINFATDLSSGKTYNRESFDHILRMYQKYEDILNKKHMENGLVTESIGYINEMYRENLKHGVVQ